MQIIANISQIIPNLCTGISKQTGYVRHLKNNVDALTEEALRLRARCEETENEGRAASRRRQRLTRQARSWLDQVRIILYDIDSIKLQFDQRRTFCNGCFPDLCSDYTLGKRAFKKLEFVRRFIDEKRDIKLVAMASPPRVMEMDVPTVGQSSAQRNLDRIWDLLHDEHTSVICIYGMGGIGKTTLMKAINNKLAAAREFDYVIWVTVSKQLNLQRIQNEIISRLHLEFDENDSYERRSSRLRQYLSNKRYMLILDDLWNPIDLSEIGIPTNKENRSKIAVTTRIANMWAVQDCSDMKAEKIRIETLTKEEAWDLFAANVGTEVVHQPHINDVAKDVAMECGGLPLAIVVVAKAMQGQNRKELWQDALRALRASAPEIQGMEPQVFRPLKRSYDDLNDEKVYISGGDNYPPGVGVMVAHTEGLKLFAVGVKDVSQLVGVANGLRMLDIEGCGKMECILDWSDVEGNALQKIEELRLSFLTSLQKLFKGEVPQRCLRKLNKIYLNNCYNLKGLFTSEMVQNLDQLQTLDVRDCNGLEEIIEGHDESLPENPFPQLRNITLKGLFNLRSIIRHDTLALPSLIKLEIDKCPKLRLPKRPDTTDWPSITHGNARWQANPQYSEHIQRPDEE